MTFVDRDNGGDWAVALGSKLWTHQSAALALAVDYLGSRSQKQAMVRMPTGTGKTVVIAILARLLRKFPRVLVVAPWQHLVAQLRTELTQGVWDKLREPLGAVARPVMVVTPATLRASIQNARNAGVFLCTNQSLQLIRSNSKEFDVLAKWTSLVLVDEGHREPAPQWARSVRDLKRPVILFTATPYRNDLQRFDISTSHTFTYTFPEAVHDRIVRSVELIPGRWARDHGTGIDDFVIGLEKVRRSVARKSGLRLSQIRTIVRCEDATDIRHIVKALRSRGEAAIGIHDTFGTTGADGLFCHTPDPKREAAEIWVHQLKLVEGLDDPGFRLVALHTGFANARGLVQQIGRVIRNPTLAQDQTAYVWSHVEDRQDEMWRGFQEYEEGVRDRVQNGSGELSAVDDFLASQANAPWFYLLGGFRRSLRAEEINDPRQIVVMRKSVRIGLPNERFDWNRLIESIRRELISGDVVAFGAEWNKQQEYLQVYQVFEQSRFTHAAFLENHLGYTFACLKDGVSYYFDSEGRVPATLHETTATIDIERLGRLLPEGSTTIKELALVSGDFGNHAFRRRLVSMNSLDFVPMALSDYVQVCTAAIGSVKQAKKGATTYTRRYVSFSRGRLSERTSPTASYPEFKEWLEGIANSLVAAGVTIDDGFQRFAQPYQYDGVVEPQHILFDITSEGLDTGRVVPNKSLIPVDDLWKIANRRFTGEIDGKQFSATVIYEPDTGKFRVVSQQLDFVTVTENQRSFLKHLNEEQDFRLLLGGSNIYAQGRFFTPNVQPWKGGRSRIGISRILTECPDLKGLASEKGGSASWAADSVFGAVVDEQVLFRAAGWCPQVLVCNDVGSPEIADFFGVDEQDRRIVMIHCKCADANSSMSASAFHEVCSQAIRYLSFFNPIDSQTKLTSQMLTTKWCPDKTKYSPKDRVVWDRSKSKKRGDLARRFTDAIANPAFAREVWIVMGNGLSKRAFETAMKKVDPRPNERELAFLLQSTWSSVGSVGATLKVFCMP